MMMYLVPGCCVLEICSMWLAVRRFGLLSWSKASDEVLPVLFLFVCFGQVVCFMR